MELKALFKQCEVEKVSLRLNEFGELEVHSDSECELSEELKVAITANIANLKFNLLYLENVEVMKNLPKELMRHVKSASLSFAASGIYKPHQTPTFIFFYMLKYLNGNTEALDHLWQAEEAHQEAIQRATDPRLREHDDESDDDSLCGDAIIMTKVDA